MKKKKIAICTVQVPFVRGGAEILVESLNTQLLKRGFNSTIVSIPFKWYPKNEILKNMLTWRMSDLSESNGMKIDMVIATKFPSYGIKHDNKVTWLVHQHRTVYDLYGTEFSDFNATPEDNEMRSMIVNFDNKTLQESKKLYTIAENVTTRLEKFNGIKGETLYHPPKNNDKFYCGEYGNYILSIGRIEPMKRVDLLVKAMKYVKSAVKCIVGGTGSHREELERYVIQNKLDAKVKFVGFINDEDLIKLYADSLAVYFAPFDEDYGYISLEAFLSKKPILTTLDAGGVLEFVDDELNGYITAVEPEQIAAKIDYLYNNKKLCEEFGNHGYEKVLPINWDSVIEKLTLTLR
ncbi:MAG: glycosyltransferase family 4 protein [Carboxydocellales bacterium]